MEVLGLAVIFFIYFLPWIIAMRRHHKNNLVIGWMNFLLGWTIIFWLVCFFWSLTANTNPKESPGNA